ncbi:phosphate ABC transporter permease subunit PstC [Paludisphaera rhizosphaerae]|uniref:phosphate ABC transporter permease subunit PstC n=1 Tax=Paludisphaera rhizosphaerae TaxID=2711216 RepID=UPI0013ED5DA5|nr:phosphate ABC transporter permease subunit PstC [Paludisphaera rhizosphaerae]
MPPDRSSPAEPTTLRETPSPDDPWGGQSRFALFAEVVAPVALGFCGAVTILTTLGILLVLLVQSVEFFLHAKISVADFLLGSVLKPEATPPKFGILPLVWGTFVIALGSSCIALPIGLMSAIYLSEYAPRMVRSILKPTLELLAGVPTIVYGYLALLMVTPLLKALLEPLGLRVEQFNALSACIVVGVMIVPLVSSLSEDVLSAVPQGLREAAYGLGATKFEVSTRIVLPAGLSGVFASFILAISRAVGETMAVVLAAGMIPQIRLNPLTSVETMTTYIVQVVGGEASYGSSKYLSLFAVGLALFGITLTLNILSNMVLRRYREVYQ